ncbi:hypothetical protein [Streptomyces sp. NPDC048612]|uniref:hypothetical protein n=1 Tax=Streptomyces sp. NPDC048612 TaxID=3365579 RepID=UPI003722BC2F
MNIITLAAAHVGDVGKKVGFDMSDGWGAVIAAVATGVFGLVVGILAYKAGRRQVKDQAAADHRAWRRQNRFDAYRRLIASVDAFEEEMDRWIRVTTRDRQALGKALEVVAAAEAGVRLAGPESMRGPAKTVFGAAGAVYRHARQPIATMMPTPPRLWTDMSRALVDAQNAFVESAAALLDDAEA